MHKLGLIIFVGWICRITSLIFSEGVRFMGAVSVEAYCEPEASEGVYMDGVRCNSRFSKWL